MVERFRRGKRLYTHWDKKSEQVAVPFKKKREPQNPSITVEIPPSILSGPSTAGFAVFHSRDEFVIDACTAAGIPRVIDRVIMTPVAVKRFCRELQKALRND